MKKKLYVLIPFLLFISVSFLAQRKELLVNTNFPLPNKINKPNGAIKFSGFIGKPGSPALGEMKSSKSQAEVKKECTFFSSDSLLGFDFDEVEDEDALDSEYVGSVVYVSTQFPLP